MSIPEEPKVPLSLAPTLDMSCSEARILPPEINHGKVTLYDRRRRGKKVFLVAFYTCDESYDFENDNTEMFCSNQNQLISIILNTAAFDSCWRINAIKFNGWRNLINFRSPMLMIIPSVKIASLFTSHSGDICALLH